jgi:hypothetical protein
MYFISGLLFSAFTAIVTPPLLDFSKSLKRNPCRNVFIQLEVRLNDGKFEGCKISKVLASSASVISPTSEILAVPYKGTKLQIASNSFYIHEIVMK